MRVCFCFDFIIKYIGRYALLLPIGENSFSGAVLLNHSSATIIDYLKNSTFEETITLISKKYNISFEKAQCDCEAIVSALVKGGIINNGIQ